MPESSSLRTTPIDSRRKVSLVLSDVDGTLLTGDKVLTDRARAAVRSLRAHGILFAITSGRPPRGMRMLFDPLELDTPVAGFNGGVFTTPDLTVLEQKTLPQSLASEAVSHMRHHGLDAWIYTRDDWLVTDPEAPHVARETRTVQFEPTVTPDLEDSLGRAVKVVGVGDDHDAVQRCEAEVRSALGDRAAASRSQPYYLDVTHRDANKGTVVEHLSHTLGVPLAEIVTIGDGPNDVLMFDKSGLSVAMGNASEAVRNAATSVTASCDDEGFARAIENLTLDVGPLQG
ncbi:MAG: Cof-type HAD-IIB family hydrolase [Gemmatimonadota bacterium]|jgi:hypothetical protein